MRFTSTSWSTRTISDDERPLRIDLMDSPSWSFASKAGASASPTSLSIFDAGLTRRSLVDNLDFLDQTMAALGYSFDQLGVLETEPCVHCWKTFRQ